MNQPDNPIDLEKKNKVALKMLGGGVPNVGYQLGVIDALQDHGFTIQTGPMGDHETRTFGARTLNPIIGSSSGAFTGIAAAMGYGKDDLLGRTNRLKTFQESTIKDRTESGPISFLWRLFTSRQKYTRLKQLVNSTPSTYEHLINAYYPIWKMDRLEAYVRNELLNGHDFEDLKTQLLVLSVAQEQRMTFVFGDQSRPARKELDYKFQSGVPAWKAAAGSMCLPPYFQPYRLKNPPEEMLPPEAEDIVLIDGETRDAFSTDAAEDSGADLIIVSSFYRIMEYNHRLGHIDEYGIMPVMWQEEAQGKDARKHDSIQSRSRRQQALTQFRSYLQQHCPDQCEQYMSKMESILDMREELDVIEIQAQDYTHENITYPYWDPFTVNEDVLDFLYQAGYEVASEALDNRLRD